MKTISIRPFIGAANFSQSREFYTRIGFEETILAPDFSVFEFENLSFYLQDAFVKDWIDNSQIFLEVVDLKEFHMKLTELNLPIQFPGVRLSAIQIQPWGSECFLHDPSGILWHIGCFS